MRIYIVGLPSSGKTTLGRPLAKHLGLDLVDLDHWIEEEENCSIPNIFKYKGEDYFRQKEKEALHEVSKRDNLLISTGGGVPCFFDNMKFMNNKGITLFLDVSAQELYKRMTQNNGTEDRPLLKGKEADVLLKELEDKYKTRFPFYNEARLRLKGDNIQSEHLIEAIEEILD